MPQYVKTVWVNGTVPALNDSNLNKMEQGIFDAFRQDGSTTMSGQLVTTAGSAATPAIAPTGDSNTGIFFPSADTIAFGEGGAEAMRINSSGQVGIGTTSPTSELHVYANGGVADLMVETNTTGGDSKIALKCNGAGGRHWYWQTGDTGSALNGRLRLLDSTAGAERLTITGAGNVGVGTSNPANIFSVVSVTGQTGLNAGTVSSPVKGNLWYDTDGSGWKFQIGKWQSSAFTAQMTFQDNGNVGIGTSSISSVFGTTVKVAGSTGATIETSATNVNLRQFVSDSLALGAIGTSTNHPFYFLTNDAERMRITSAGNVGIGTTSPQSILHVTDMGLFSKNQNGPNELIGAYIGNDGSYATLDMRRWSGSGTIHGTGKIQVTDTAAMIFYTDTKSTNTASTTERMRITSAGNVGIGVNPNVELHVKGTGEIFRLETTAATGDNFIRFYAPSATTQGYVGYTSAANNNMSINQVLNSDLLFFTDNTERMRIQNSGGVIPSANNTYDLGSASFRWATIYAQNALNTSDARLKTDVTPSSLGLDFIAALNPVQYRWIEGGNTVEKVQTGTETVEITPAIPAQPEVLDEDGNVIQEATQEVPAVTEERPVYETVVTPREGVRTHFGLIAQEVKSALPDGLDFAGWCLADKDDANSTQSLGYTQLISPMIKAIQELKAEIDTLKAQLNGN